MKKILVLNFFPAFTPPASGGELRYFHMYQNLSKYFDITLLSPTHNDNEVECIEHSASFREYRIPKEDIHNEIHWKLEQENFSPEFSALTCAYSGKYLNNYHQYYLKLYTDADIIIHESPFMLNYDLFFGIDNKPRIYNSYNVEYDLLKQIYHGLMGKKHLSYIFALEKKLVTDSDVIFSISDIEKQKFEKFYGANKSKIKLAPNGINPKDFSKRNKKIKRQTAFFIGSGHPPNIEAVHFIIDSLADRCPEITFLIAGSCCSGINSEKKNVKLLGKVDENEKIALFKTSDIAINPMFSGAGTNLKTLEYLSMGIPMISTDVGARGIDLKDGEHFILANSGNFAKKLNSLVDDLNLKTKISKQSKLYIDENFDWQKIAKNVYDGIMKIDKKHRKILLLLNDFEVSKPFGGGEIRINKLYSELSKTYNVLLLCLNGQKNIKKSWITDSFLEISFPKTEEHLNEEVKINLQHHVSVTDIVNSYMISKNNLFMNAIKAIAPFFDVTVLCHPYMYETVKGLKYKFLVYESLNYELLLKKELLSGHPSRDKLIQQTEKIEHRCCVNSDLIISVSDTDHEGLKNYDKSKNLEIITIKNGIEIIDDILLEEQLANIKTMFAGHFIVLFIGSSHMPNIDSAKYILQTLAIERSDCYFVLIGSVCDAIMGENIPPNVLLFGKLSDEYKNVLFSIADIAINPMFGGSGSNLKLAEYFAWKLPTITTKFGARGYDIQDGKEAIICDIEEFSKNIIMLQNNKQKAEMLTLHALEYVQSNIEWSMLGKQYRDLLDDKVFGIKRKKLLIVTYRFTNPPLGGAEAYMYELIRGLDELGDFDITVAYLDSYDIENQYHFSISATHNTKSMQNEFKHVAFRKFKYDELNNRGKLENARILMKSWTDEFLESARKFIHFYDQSILLGGWNFPEKVDASSKIWTSSISEVYVTNTETMIVKGFSPSKKVLSFKINNINIYEKKVNNTFSVEIVIPNDCVVTLECTEEYLGEDVRPLGVLIDSIVCDHIDLDLAYGYRNFLKDNYLDKYTDELISIASQRDKILDNIFQETRGLNSSELELYLDEHTKEFDVLLGHSIPFATTIITSDYALKYNKPYALLPHFHFDDEFYHWKSYYEAMKKADTVFASPNISINLFYNKLNINSLEVPGGGIGNNEYDDIDSKAFLALYQSDKPFFFVLGRKSGAKNYDSIIEAIEKVNEKGHLCNLVMIGREEDGITVDSKYTYYFREQPREVVLGALKECYSLVTMSESESFGIVILEAWMLKKPVIINERCPAFIELVEDGVNGLYANKLNLADMISYLLHDKATAHRLGKNGNRVVDDYVWNKISNKLNKELLGLSENASI